VDFKKGRLSFKLALAAIVAGALAGCNAGGTAADGTATGAGAGTHAAGGAAARPMPTADGHTVEGDEIVIGLVASQNGDLRPWGVDSVRGAELAIAEVNDAGGIGGKRIRLETGDSMSLPEQGKNAAENLVARHRVVGLVGEVASGITRQIATVAFENGIPLVAIGATNPAITEYGNTFRVCYTDDMQGPVMAKFAYEELGLRRIGLVTDKKQPYSTGLSDSFEAYFTKLGGEIVAKEFYESGQTQFAAQLTNLRQRQPDGLFMSGYFNEVGPLARQARQAGITVPLLGGDGWDSAEILRTGGDAILGGFFCNHYNHQEDREEVRQFLSKWRERFPNQPVPATTMGALGYDAMALMLDAIRRAHEADANQPLNSRRINDALENTVGFRGVSGTITLQGMGGDPPKRAIVVRLTPQGQEFVKAYEADEVPRL
jgi:branched-chain amino acid transport system substrate-binding protein